MNNHEIENEFYFDGFTYRNDEEGEMGEEIQKIDELIE